MDRVREALLCDAAGVDGAGVRIAVLDTGIDLDHPDFAGRINLRDSASFGMSGDLRDHHGHGSHVAGIIAGTGAASGGRYRGIAPGAELVILKTSDGATGSAHDVAAAVQRAVELGVDVINYSGGDEGYHLGPPPWKWPTRLPVRDRLFVAAVERGILCVAAAGNEGPRDGTVIRPGNLEALIRISAIRLAVGDVKDYGHGGLIWPNVQASLADFIHKPDFRSIVLHGRQLRLEP